jgi:thermostable 8-oxoguanine DNA glycosylase
LAVVTAARIKKSSPVNINRADAILVAISKRPALVRSYVDYWEKLKPQSLTEYMDRWIFSVVSYLNTWQNNVRAYKNLCALGYPFHRLGYNGLLDKVIESGCGIHDRRAQTLWAVDSSIWNYPGKWYPSPGEPLTECRNRLKSMAKGLGWAKTSFVLEMLLPASCEVTCIDRHVLRLYGIDKEKVTLTDQLYFDIEAHWVGRCRELSLPAPMARHIMWDQMRLPAKWSTRYWSYVLENPSLAAAGHYNVAEPRYKKPLAS